MAFITKMEYVQLHAIKDFMPKRQIMNVKLAIVDALNVLEVEKTFVTNVKSDIIYIILYV